MIFTEGELRYLERRLNKDCLRMSCREKSGMDWERFFQGHILDRGYDYYCDGRVSGLHFSEDKIEALVEGSEDYVVRIFLKDGEVSRMFCSCPYAEDGTPCKHMAAVLYEYEEDDDDEECDDEDLDDDEWEHEAASHQHGEAADTSGSSSDSKRSSNASLFDMVEAADDSLVRRFLLDVLQDDEKLALRFYSLTRPVVSPEDMKKYKKRVDQLIRRYQGRGGFIDYYSAGPFMNEILGEMEDLLGSMCDNQCFREAFELSAYTFVQVSKVEMDDSDGELSWFADVCTKWWERILEGAEDTGQTDLQEIMFDWFTGHLDGSIIDYMEETVEDFLKDHFNQGDLQEKKLAFTDEMISAYQSGSGHGDYSLNSWLMARIEIMQEMGGSWEELRQFCKGHWKYRSVRDWYADACKDRGEFEEAILTLEQSLMMDGSYPGLVSGYCLRLKELYQVTGKKQKYLDMLWRICTEINPGNLVYFLELKEQYRPEEWPEIREKLFTSISKRTSCLELYREEKLYDRLLQGVLSEHGLYSARKYKKDLLPTYREEYLLKYEEEVERSAEHVSDRKHYRELAGVLLEIQQFPGGLEKAAEIEQHWREVYRNRRAMMDELNQMLKRKT